VVKPAWVFWTRPPPCPGRWLHNSCPVQGGVVTRPLPLRRRLLNHRLAQGG
ncbi:hypothetical protein KI387_021050, partial [Taxus chinensis]